VAYDDALLGVVRQEEGLDALPVVTGVDFGHTDPIWTIPQGIPVAIGPDVQRITFLEAGVT
jgi:muramoyltetrapeptide carboxypeptidase LdcA involved in peptidoglycan recycling